MKQTRKTSLQRTMVIYFILIGFAAAFVGTEFVMDVGKKSLRDEVTQSYDQLAQKKIQPDDAFHPVLKLRNKAILMVAIIFAVVVILLTMFIKNITRPLQHTIEVSKLIAEGDLSRSVNIKANNELTELGDTINELTSNLQEMILLSEDMCATSDRFVKEVSDMLDTLTLDRGRTEDLRHEMQVLNAKARFFKDIIHNCKFYGIER